jgi:NADPH:quinone reductase-like Zn-dependent oxidoreductase
VTIKPSTMRAVVVPRFGGPDVLEVSEVPQPRSDDGSVLVRVTAAAVSNTDVLLRSGAQQRFLTGLSFPYVPGMDLAGEIHASADPQWPVGMRVMAAVSAWRDGGGAQAQIVGVPVESLAHSPLGLSDIEACTLPMNGLTAAACLDGLGLAEGATVAVLGSAGAVGGLVVQLAKARGLHVIADAAPDDADLVRQLGADIVVPRGPDLLKAVSEHARLGVDGVVDTAVLGQAAVHLAKDFGAVASLRPQTLMPERGVVEVPVFVPDHLCDTEVLAELSRLADSGHVSARVAEVFRPAQASEAHRLLERGGVRGRPVLDFSAL